MDQKIIDAVAAAGFDVWMRDPKDTWLLFTDGKNIGYLQDGRLEGLTLTTVHKPNTSTGTGFGMGPVVELTYEALAQAFVHAPHWAGHGATSVRKYRDMEDYRKASAFNAEYRLIKAGKRE